MSVDPILVDLYPGDLGGRPNYQALVAVGRPFCGVWLKATQGVHYAYVPWFVQNLQAAKAAARRAWRLGVDFLVGSYAYLEIAHGGAEQAAYYADTIERAGGLDENDIHPVIDIEGADNPPTSAQHIIDVVSSASAYLKKRFGRSVLLYAGSYLADHGIKDRMGCDGLITALYGASGVAQKARSIGWDRPTMWQYQGTGAANLGRLPGYPTSIKGFAGPAQVDLSVYTAVDRPTIDDLRRDLTACPV